jgi:hypothetical protein
MARPPFRVGSFPSACPRSYTNLRPTSSHHLGRRNGPSQIRRLSGAIRPSRDSYVAYPTKRHDAFALLHPRFACARYASRPYALFAQSSIRRTYSSTAEAPSSSIEGSQSVRPEPPDHLNEKEKAIFDRLIEALEPVELQVRLPLHSYTRHETGLV